MLSIYFLMTCVVSLSAFADEKVYLSVKAEEISVNTGYIRETIPGTSISSAYMTIQNTSSKKISLIGASSDFSPRIEIHEHTMEDGMMRMRQRKSIEIPAEGEVILQPSGLHLMIFDLKKPLKEGQTVSIILHFSTHEELTIQLPIQSIKRKKRSEQHQHKHH